ncbi:MAG TPA: hypothetical protein VGN04_06245 [Herbaspirillum sp.]|jgi:hypothetical protein
MIQSIREAQILEPKTTHEAHSILQPSSPSGYLLHIDVSEQETHRLETKDTENAFRFPVYPTPSGAMWAVPTIQVGDFQLRIAVPLVDDKAIAWARWCIASKKVRFLFRVNETDRFIDLNVTQDFPKSEILLDLIKYARRDLTANEFAIDMVFMLQPLSELHAIDSRIIGIEVTDVCLAVVVDRKDRSKESWVQTQHPAVPHKSTLH